jgi:hypothetical protein
VTDINLLFTANWSDTTDSARRYGMRTMIGAPEIDAAQLKAASPLANAIKIKQPLLLPTAAPTCAFHSNMGGAFAMR